MYCQPNLLHRHHKIVTVNCCYMLACNLQWNTVIWRSHDPGNEKFRTISLKMKRWNAKGAVSVKLSQYFMVILWWLANTLNTNTALSLYCYTEPLYKKNLKNRHFMITSFVNFLSVKDGMHSTQYVSSLVKKSWTKLAWQMIVLVGKGCCAALISEWQLLSNTFTV